MIEYIIEIIIWTVLFYGIFEFVRKLINKFIISNENIKSIFSKTKSENKRL